MNDVPVQVIVAAYQEEDAADQALKSLKEAKKDKLIGIENAAVIKKDEDGKLHIKETADLGGGKGAVAGGSGPPNVVLEVVVGVDLPAGRSQRERVGPDPLT